MQLASQPLTLKTSHADSATALVAKGSQALRRGSPMPAYTKTNALFKTVTIYQCLLRTELKWLQWWVQHSPALTKHAQRIDALAPGHVLLGLIEVLSKMSLPSEVLPITKNLPGK